MVDVDRLERASVLRAYLKRIHTGELQVDELYIIVAHLLVDYISRLEESY